MSDRGRIGIKEYVNSFNHSNQAHVYLNPSFNVIPDSDRMRVKEKT